MSQFIFNLGQEYGYYSSSLATSTLLSLNLFISWVLQMRQRSLREMKWRACGRPWVLHLHLAWLLSQECGLVRGLPGSGSKFLGSLPHISRQWPGVATTGSSGSSVLLLTSWILERALWPKGGCVAVQVGSPVQRMFEPCRWRGRGSGKVGGHGWVEEEVVRVLVGSRMRDERWVEENQDIPPP